jgi:hypothetical protein
VTARRYRLPRYRVMVLLICMGPITLRPAAAQTAEEESVARRPRPDFAPDGIALPDLLDGATRLVSASAREAPRDDAGSDLTLFPTLETDLIADSNILRTENQHQGDFGARLSGGVTLSREDELSGWSLAAQGDSTRYLRFSSQNGDQTSFRETGFWTPDQDVRVDLSVSERWQVEPLEDTGISIGRHRPNRYVEYDAQTSASYANDDWQVVASQQAKAYRFARNPPLVVDNELDRQQFLSTLHVARTLFEGTALYIEPSVNLRQYSREISIDGLRHNSSGGQLLGGMRYDLSSVTYVEAGAGWLRQEYVDKAFATVSGPALDGRAVWNPRDQLSLTLAVTRRIAESELPGTAGVETTAESAAADYEILDNLLADCSFSYTDMHYRFASGQSSRIDDITQYGVELRYLIDRNFSLAASWADYRRSSSTPGQALNFDRLSLSAQVHW